MYYCACNIAVTISGSTDHATVGG